MPKDACQNPAKLTCNGKTIELIDCTFETAKGLPIQIPDRCPECDTKLERRANVDGSDSAVLFCPGQDCPAQTAGKIRRFCKSRDILGLGESVISGLLNDTDVNTVADLFGLKPEKIENVIINRTKGIRLGRKRAEAICAEIAEKTKTMPLAEFLGAFGTRGLGVRRATLMIQTNPELGSLEKWFDGSLLDPDFAQKAGVPQLGKIIYEDLKTNENTIRTTMKNAMTEITETPKQTTPQTGGLTVCITGKLPSGKKKHEYAGPLAAKGHRLVDDLTKDVNALVMADPDGPESSKTKKAKKLGIGLKNEAWLEQLCQAG